jgi:hypothetical protein
MVLSKSLYMSKQHSKTDNAAPQSTHRSYVYIRLVGQEGNGVLNNSTIIGQGLSYSIEKMSNLTLV